MRAQVTVTLTATLSTGIICNTNILYIDILIDKVTVIKVMLNQI